jgi:hypothetical protein
LDNVDETLADRNTKYNSGEGHTRNCYLAATLRRIYREHKAETDLLHGGRGTKHDLSHDHCIEMVLGKIARIATGAFVEDNYHDIEGYIRLALKDMQSQTQALCNEPNPKGNIEGCNLRPGHRGHHNWPTEAYIVKPG